MGRAWAKGSACWESAAPLPAPRNQFSTVTLDGKSYAIGGQFHHDSQQIDQARVDIYDPKTNSWSRGPELPKGHSHSEGGTFVSGGRIYMVGGHTTPDGGRKRIDADILALTPGAQWEVVAKLPMPLSSPSAAIIGGKLYVAGGSPNGSSVQGKMWWVRREQVTSVKATSEERQDGSVRTGGHILVEATRHQLNFS